MILVTLGTQDKSFSRLLKAIDKTIQDGLIKEEVIVQAGFTKYKPISKGMKIFDLVSAKEFEELMDKCTLLITHGGVGSILSGIKHNKPVIAAARLKQYKEHTNDHQIQIIKNFSKQKYILELEEFSDLGELIIKSKKIKFKKFKSNTSNMIELISNYIDNN